jgi:uncharacterized phiE125 gp8 family phage protein
MLDLVLTTPPALELVTLDEVKAHLRMEGIDDRDDTLQAHLDTAIAALDGYAGRLGRALAPQTWTLYLDAFPRCGMSATPRPHCTPPSAAPAAPRLGRPR